MIKKWLCSKKWLVLAVAFGAIGAAPAAWSTWHLYLAPIQPWPQGEIAYYNDTDWDETLKEAVNQWNRLGLGVRFHEVNDLSQADLIVKEKLEINCQRCIGMVTTLGYRPESVSALYLQPPLANDSHDVNRFYIDTIIHELGHILVR